MRKPVVRESIEREFGISIRERGSLQNAAVRRPLLISLDPPENEN
ncbi:hypothetical protein [Arthrobacter globiformis]|nr:hypothetical protein [Arthrobacter globiformis]MDQ0619367.1 hypothetical protein [Arthrobacter globiformis]